MIRETLKRKAEKICPKKDREKGLCGCMGEIRVGQTNFFPRESTDLMCHVKIY